MKALDKTPSMNTLVNNLDIVIKELQNPLVDGILINDVPLNSGVSVPIPHGLDREVNGWIVVRKNAFTDIIEVSSSNRFLTLQASTSAVVSLWVF